jgi:catechol 2,3-dioxygenase-like lactoylglutathione lyase family enzyme
MLGHLSFGVSDLAHSTKFYDAVMAALGYERVYASETAVGYGLPGTDVDKLLLVQQSPGSVTAPGPGFHVAFFAPSREAVDQFHATALKFGGIDSGAAGPRPAYGPTYYAAFVLDPDGYKLEAKYPPNSSQ